jgi:hypothetical protein
MGPPAAVGTICDTEQPERGRNSTVPAPIRLFRGPSGTDRNVIPMPRDSPAPLRADEQKAPNGEELKEQ